MGLIFLAAGLLGMVVLAVVGGRMKDVSPSPVQALSAFLPRGSSIR